MGTLILLFMQKHIVKIALIVGALLLIVGVYTKGYYKGKHNAEAAMAQEVAEEMAKRDAQTEKDRAIIQALKDKIAQNRQANPKDDTRDSCLLSNNPYTTDCIKKGK